MESRLSCAKSESFPAVTRLGNDAGESPPTTPSLPVAVGESFRAISRLSTARSESLFAQQRCVAMAVKALLLREREQPVHGLSGAPFPRHTLVHSTCRFSGQILRDGDQLRAGEKERPSDDRCGLHIHVGLLLLEIPDRLPGEVGACGEAVDQLDTSEFVVALVITA